MIELNDLNGKEFVLNCDLIETIESIPETKITLTTGKYFLVGNDKTDIINRVAEFYKKIYGNMKTIHVAEHKIEDTDCD